MDFLWTSQSSLKNLNQKHRKDVEGLRISLKYSKLSVLVFISIVFHSKKRYNISKTDIFDLGGTMEQKKLNKYFDYSLEPRRAILFQDVKSNYASIECVQRNLNPLTTSLCVMSRADHSKGLTLASSPTLKKFLV